MVGRKKGRHRAAKPGRYRGHNLMKQLDKANKKGPGPKEKKS